MVKTEDSIQLRPAKAAARWDTTERWLEHRRHAGDGPPYYKVSAKLIFYPVAEGDAWFAAYRRRSTSGNSPKPEGDHNAAA